ncbi:DUF6220 domain-containing protein [Paenibacillus lautus]|uniref:DUF6220 domain-containing protein n=1 Tax=Paenibacillus lautus TaxID=1401 RepID=UPI000FDA7151|nr:DUF6220 domain-containing protein [Paenibacillus lautus]
MNDEAIKKEPYRVRYCRLAYSILALVLLICIVVQVYLAGMALFGNSEVWKWHRSFVPMFGYISVILFILGIIGKLNRKMIWGSLGLFVLISFQYITALHIAGALHPVLALALFWGALALVRGSYPFLKKRNK